jgi:hypothetical protein
MTRYKIDSPDPPIFFDYHLRLSHTDMSGAGNSRWSYYTESHVVEIDHSAKLSCLF